MATTQALRGLNTAARLACLAITVSLLSGKAQAASAPGAIYSLAAYPHARCNDGTMGMYYFRPGSKAGLNKWIIYLEGGKECYSDQTCETERNNSLPVTTSTGWTIGKPGGMISNLPLINPAFFNANAVEIHYCSSDYWSGDKAATDAFMPGNADTGWSFRGRAIAHAVLKDLTARNDQTNFLAATDVAFAGSSAGGLGIVYLVNDIAALAPATANKLLVVDAGYAISINGFDPNNPPSYMTTTDPTAAALAAGLVLWNGHGDTGCNKAATTQQAMVACYNTSNLLDNGYVTIPAFIAQSELDTDQLSQHSWHGTVTQDAAHMAYATEFADSMVAALQATPPATSVFAPQRLVHTLMSANLEYENLEQFPDMMLASDQAVANWYAAPATPARNYGNAEMLP